MDESVCVLGTSMMMKGGHCDDYSDSIDVSSNLHQQGFDSDVSQGGNSPQNMINWMQTASLLC